METLVQKTYDGNTASPQKVDVSAAGDSDVKHHPRYPIHTQESRIWGTHTVNKSVNAEKSRV